MQQPLFLQDKAVAERYGVSRATIWRWVTEGRISAPIRLTEGCTRWRLADLEKFEQGEAKRA